MNKYFNEYISYLFHIRKLSNKTIQSYKRDLELFQIYYKDNPQNLTPDEIRIILSKLIRDNYSHTSINRFLASLRGFYKYLIKFKHIDFNPLSQIKNLKTTKKIPVYLDHKQAIEFCMLPEKLSKNFNNFGDNKSIDGNEKKTLWASRDKALFFTLYSTGCRVSEIASLKFENINLNQKTAIVKGKGDKERYVFFSKQSLSALKEYLAERQSMISRLQDQTKINNYVFLSKKGNQLSVRGIQFIINHYVEISGLQNNISPHSLRHSFATTLMTKGADIRIVQEMLGHENISTTQRYTHVTSDELKKIYHQAHPHG